MLLNPVSAAIHTDTNFGATKNGLLEATYHPDMLDTKNWAEQHFFDFCISVKIGPKSVLTLSLSLLLILLCSIVYI